VSSFHENSNEHNLKPRLVNTRCLGITTTCLKSKCHISAHQNFREKAKCRSSQRKDHRDLRQDHSQQTGIEHHRNGPTSTQDVCTYIVEHTQGCLWQQENSLDIETLYRTQQWLYPFLFSLLVLPFSLTWCFHLHLKFTERLIYITGTTAVLNGF
jgi:hypothetical protein